MKLTDKTLEDSIDMYYDTDYYNPEIEGEKDPKNTTEITLKEDTLIGNFVVKKGTKIYITI